MDKASQRRWLIWGVLLLGTLVAIFLPESSNNDATPQRSEKNTSKPQVGVLAQGDAVDEEENDPFAPRGWEPPPPPPPPAPKQVVAQKTEAIQAPLPVSAPPLPYSYMGQMNDGGEQVVYLGRGDQLVVARVDETLEGVYKVLKMSSTEIEFLHLPTGEKQLLSMNSARP